MVSTAVAVSIVSALATTAMVTAASSAGPSSRRVSVSSDGHVNEAAMFSGSAISWIGSCRAATASVATPTPTSGAGTGVFVSGANASGTISGNTGSIHGNTIGIDVDGGSATITGNHIYDNTTGIRFTGGGSGSVTGNSFDDTNDNATDMLLTSTAGVVSAVFFTILLVAGNTMSQSVRERTEEIGVLKAMGYPNGLVLVLVLLESCLLALLGGLAGLGLAWLVTLGGSPMPQMLPVFVIPHRDLILGAGFAVALGLIAGAVPALHAMRLQIAVALRKLG